MSPRLSAEETARRGDEIYERDIKPTLSEDQQGYYISIDIDSGSWTIADTLQAAIDEMYAQHSEASEVWSLRVGRRALHRIRRSSLCRYRPRSRDVSETSGLWRAWCSENDLRTV